MASFSPRARSAGVPESPPAYEDVQRRAHPLSTRLSRTGWQGVKYALLLFYMVLCLYPFLWMLSTSLRSSGSVFSAGISLWVDDPQWANYREIWEQANVPRAAMNTVLITAVTMTVTIFTTSMTAFAVTRSDFPGRKIVMVALLTTFLIPGEMLIIPTFYVNRSLHLVGDWRSLIAVILVMTAGAQVFNIYLLIGHFRTLPTELYDAAAVDGESYFGTYRRIAFPLVRPALATISLLTFMGVWNAYIVPLVYLAPLREYQTLTIALIQYSKQFQTLYHVMAAGAVITLAPVIVVFIFLQRYFVRGLTEGATKG
ncbi:MAG TPA: carbohydrate ABC transporter permease [Thermomicrobiales bacterium]|nr:carbohydrate ABC transporter permease [Thermomicrobiales bacterium]